MYLPWCNWKKPVLWVVTKYLSPVPSPSQIKCIFIWCSIFHYRWSKWFYNDSTYWWHQVSTFENMKQWQLLSTGTNNNKWHFGDYKSQLEPVTLKVYQLKHKQVTLVDIKWQHEQVTVGGHAQVSLAASNDFLFFCKMNEM